PNTILIDFSGFAKNKDGIKKFLWDAFQIDSLGTEYNDFDEPVIWAWAAGKVVEKIAAVSDGATVAHFHEWLAGAGILYLKGNDVRVATVFTTHATVLGRTLASESRLYDMLDTVDADAEASKRGQGTKAKHFLEKQSAQKVDIFTTVSEITGIEAEKLLGRKPDVLVPNGLDMAKYPTFEEISIRHNRMKSKIFDFLLAYFFPYYAFELNDTLVFFLAGRYEFHDKGIDIFIKALGILNDRLKAEKSAKTVVTFFWVPGNIKGIRQNLLESKTYYRDMKEQISDNIDEIEHNIMHSLVSNMELTKENLFSEELREELKRKVLRFKRKGKPPLVTHDLYGESDDLIVRALLDAGLDNDADDRVKTIYYPVYLSGADGLLDLTYYEAMQGSHLGVFPSYYEPWGYTPLEAGALGVPSVTTDLAGFGRFICNECSVDKNPGIWVLKRWQRSDDDVVNQLAEQMHYYATLPKHDRIQNKLAARSIANNADWKMFIERYIEAQNRAIEKLL
ncbi:MAG TPA: glycosyltransferase, partial [Candidatus Binatia bacterium]|nr:glycosyltransferase [Candidatus Binatia bacterium]